MMRTSLALTAVLAVSLPARSWADPPQLTGTGPLGVPRGLATEVTIQGANLAGNPQLVAPFPATVEPAPGGDAAKFKLKLTAGPGTPVGVYPIRVKTDDGISNPVMFAVGQVVQAAEAEENSTFEQAQAVPVPVVMEGQTPGSDVDYFKFPGKKGQKIVVDALCARIGSTVDPAIRLTTARHGYLAAADDSPGLMTDARLIATLPEDGDYVVELSDTKYQGGAKPIYRLLIGAVPVADETYPIGGKRGDPLALELRGGTLAGPIAVNLPLNVPAGVASYRPQVPGQPAPPLEVELIAPLAVGDAAEIREPADPAAPLARGPAPAAFNGRIDPAGDEDRFAVAVTPGQAYRARVLASEYASALDGQLQVLGANGALLIAGDDQNTPSPVPAATVPLVSPDPSVDFTPPAGLAEVTLVIRDLEGRGGVGFPYRIVVEPITPTFDVKLAAEAQVSIPKGGTAAVPVTVTRRGYTGPITLTILEPPPGLVVRPGTIPDGQAAGALTVSAAADAAFGAVELKVVGQGAGPGGPIVRPAEKLVIFAQQSVTQPQAVTVPTNDLTFSTLAAAPALPGAVSLDAPAGPVEVVHGYGAPVPIKVTRTPGADGALAITPLPLSGGLAVPAANIAEKAAEGAVPVNAAVESPLGKVSVALTAKGKFANVDRTFAVPLITLDVVRPAALELAAPGVEVKPGAAVEVKGKVIRKGPFKEPVTVRIDGLPAGLKADPATLVPEVGDFTLKITADPAAVPAQAASNVAIAFQVNKKDYATPPAPLAVKVLPK